MYFSEQLMAASLSSEMSDEVSGQQFVPQLSVLRRHGGHAGGSWGHSRGWAGGR